MDTASPRRRRTTNNVRFTDIESEFDDLRRDSLEEAYAEHVPDAGVKYKDIRGHPDGATQQQQRSNTQTSEQKESGYFSNPRSTSSKNHGMQLPASTRAVTATEQRKLKNFAPMGNRRQTFQHMSPHTEPTMSDDDDDHNETTEQRRSSTDKATFLHRPIFDNHRRKETTTIIKDVIDEVSSYSESMFEMNYTRHNSCLSNKCES